MRPPPHDFSIGGAICPHPYWPIRCGDEYFCGVIQPTKVPITPQNGLMEQYRIIWDLWGDGILYHRTKGFITVQNKVIYPSWARPGPRARAGAAGGGGPFGYNFPHLIIIQDIF